MNNPNPSPAAGPVDLLLLACWLAAEAVAHLLLAAVALLLVLIDWRPAAAAAPPSLKPVLLAAAPEPIACPSVPDLTALRVVELRALARAAGLRQLGHRGRRSELLAALGAC